MESDEIAFRLHLSFMQEHYDLPNGFVWGLKDESDWAFVIKLHALFEALVTELLLAELGREELQNLAEHMELSAKPVGKLEACRSLGILKDEEVKFIRKLSEIRNRVVHNIREVNFGFAAYFEKLDEQQFHSLVDALGFGIKSEIIIDGKKITKRDQFRDNPKHTIFVASLNLMFTIQERRITKKHP